MKKKLGIFSALLFVSFLFFGTNAHANQTEKNVTPSSFQPYFSSVTIKKTIPSFESADFAIPKLPVVSSYHVNIKFHIDLAGTDNFLVEHYTSDGSCIQDHEIVAGSKSQYFFMSTVGSSNFGSDFKTVRVTNLSPASRYFNFTYVYKLSTDPTDFVGL